MKFEKPLIKGKLIRRYKRFLADIELEDGTVVVAHCTNTGTMKTCIEEGAAVMLSQHDDPKRKTKYTWELIFINGGWIGINTLIPNKLAFEALNTGTIQKLRGYTSIKREVKYGESRLDLMAENEHEKCYIEVKNVTMKQGKFALFPDAVSSRGLKHLNTLVNIKQNGHRAVMLYVIQRMDVVLFGAAKKIDPVYADKLTEAFESGVEIIPVQAIVSPDEIFLGKTLPFVL